MTNQLMGPVLPPLTGEKPKQLVVLLHGYGADGANLIGLGFEWQHALPNAEFVAPNAPVPCEMGGPGFQWFSLMERTPEKYLQGIQEAHPILDEYIDLELKKRDLTDKDLCLVGFSQGTMMSLYTAPRRQNACAGIVGFSGRLFGEDGLADATAKPPVRLIHGEMDDVVPFDSMAHAEKSLRENGFDVDGFGRPNLPHSIDNKGVELAETFLKKHLGY